MQVFSAVFDETAVFRYARRYERAVFLSIEILPFERKEYLGEKAKNSGIEAPSCSDGILKQIGKTKESYGSVI